VQVKGSHGSIHGKHGGVTHGSPPPVKGGERDCSATGPCRHTAPEVLEVRTETGFDVKLDPTPLTPVEELAATVAGRRTYSRRWVRGEVYSRSAYKIRVEPAGSNPYVTVHAEHQCPPAATPPTTGDQP